MGEATHLADFTRPVVVVIIVIIVVVIVGGGVERRGETRARRVFVVGGTRTRAVDRPKLHASACLLGAIRGTALLFCLQLIITVP